jgi:hypothetical protein
MAPEVTYFDPTQNGRVDGLAAMNNLLVPITGKIKIDRYDMVNPKVQRHGDVAVLTSNLVNYRRQADGTEQPIVRWNSTETYACLDGRWHSSGPSVRRAPARKRAIRTCAGCSRKRDPYGQRENTVP